MKRNTSILIALAVALAIAAVVALVCFLDDDVKIQNKIYYEYFDTVSVIYDYSELTESEFTELSEKLRTELDNYHRLYDIYHEYSDINNLATLNKSAGQGAVAVDRRIIDLLEYGKELHAVTGGEVNIAMGAVLQLWHDAREARTYIPSMAELTAAAEHTDINNIVIDKERSTVELVDPLMSIDVGALAKGYAVERLAEYAEELGMTSLVIDIGGNVRTVGEYPIGGGWQISIQNPDISSQQKYAATLEDVNGAVVTSGNYQRYFIFEGKNYHHIIDKDTLMPTEYFASVSVYAADSALADALSTALFAMPYEDGLLLASNIEEVFEVVWVHTNGEVVRYTKHA